MNDRIQCIACLYLPVEGHEHDALELAADDALEDFGERDPQCEPLQVGA